MNCGLRTRALPDGRCSERASKCRGLWATQPHRRQGAHRAPQTVTQRLLLRCPIKSSGLRFSSILSTAATRSPPCFRLCGGRVAPPESPLWVLSWRNKKVPPPAGMTSQRVLPWNRNSGNVPEIATSSTAPRNDTERRTSDARPYEYDFQTDGQIGI